MRRLAPAILVVAGLPKAYHRAVRRVLALLLILGLSLAACGKANYVSPAEKRLAVALSRCGDRAESTQEEDRASAERRSLVEADRGLPRVGRLIAAAHASKVLQATLDTLAKAGGASSPEVAGDAAKLYHARVKLYEEEKAFGIRCIQRPEKPNR